jgi:plasmid stabilization system protein ParE
MPYRISILERAIRDADSIFAWLVKRSPRGALRWLVAYEVVQEKLSQDPLRYGLAPEASRVQLELRQAFFKTPRGKLYRAVFIVAGDQVRILRVRGPHQRLLRKKDLPNPD